MKWYPETFCSQCGRGFGPGPHGYSHCKDHDKHWVEFENLTMAQQSEAMALRPKWPVEDFRRFEFWLKDDGHVSRRGGHHKMTRMAWAEECAKFTEPVRSKNDLADYVTATFHVSKP
jgi:hypothetical protein